jgi:hypothetical protein
VPIYHFIVIKSELSGGLMFKKHIACIAVFFLSFSSMATITSDNINKIVGVRIDDLVEYSPSVIPGLANLAPLIFKKPSYFFPLREIDLIHDVFLSKLPEINNGQVTLSVVAFVKYKTNLNIFEICIHHFQTPISSQPQLINGNNY